MKKRQKPWFDRFLDKHPYFQLTFSIISLIVAIIVLVLSIMAL